MKRKIRVAVIFGGQSSEHEVSRDSAQSVIENMDPEKYDVVMLGIAKDGRWLLYDGPAGKLGTGEWQSIAENGMMKNMNSIAPTRISARSIFKAADTDMGDLTVDVVFPALHGCNGEDGTIQGLFELAGIPYVGSGVLGSALGMDKAYAKIIFEKEGIPQGRYLTFGRKQLASGIDEMVKEVEDEFAYPCFVKPSNTGSSVGITKAHDREELISGLYKAAGHDRRIIVEEYINGREIECSVLGNDDPVASTVGEVIPCNEFYDYNAKYIDNKSQIIIPADLPGKTVLQIREYAVKAFRALDCAGLARVDFFVHRDTGKVYINELNTIPGFTRISMYPKLWEASGIPYGKLIEKLIELAIERFKDNKRGYNNG